MLTSTIKRNAFRVVATVAFAAAPAFASIITVNNFDFETLPSGGLTSCGAGCGSYAIAPIWGWDGTAVPTAVVRGQLQPGTDIFTTLPGAPTIAFSNDGTISQTVDATVGIGTVYTLSVLIGHRLDGGFGGSAYLMLGSTPCLAGGSDPGSGLWGTFTATCVGTAANAGQAITIELRSLGLAQGSIVQRQGDFDNVQLSAVPEPASFLLIGSALLALKAFRRRRPTA